MSLSDLICEESRLASSLWACHLQRGDWIFLTLICCTYTSFQKNPCLLFFFGRNWELEEDRRLTKPLTEPLLASKIVIFHHDNNLIISFWQRPVVWEFWWERLHFGKFDIITRAQAPVFKCNARGLKGRRRKFLLCFVDRKISEKSVYSSWYLFFRGKAKARTTPTTQCLRPTFKLISNTSSLCVLGLVVSLIGSSRGCFGWAVF